VIQLTSGSNGVVILEQGNLSAVLTNRVWLSVLNAFKTSVTNTASVTNSLTLTITPASGLLSGAFLSTNTVNTNAQIKGVVLQNQNIGRGYFLGTNQRGSLLLQGN